MKKITLALSLLISTIGFSQNLLQNGDLEAPLATGKITAATSPWSSSITGTSSQSSVNSNSAVAHAGDQFLNMPNDFTSLRQTFTAEVGKEYTVKFWAQYISGQGQPAATDGIYISIRDVAGANGNGTQFDPLISYYIDPSTADANWNEFTFTFTATQTDLLFFISKQARLSGNPNNAARMDDFSITANSTASVKDLNQFNFSAYPNPASNNLNLSASKNIGNVIIFNVLGQKVMTLNPNKNATSINVSNLNSGVYIVKATIEGIIGSYKFVKQ
ncbi:MAG: T9SS type A sorting domain-containing protein [Polaribacter sp.]|uniref:T9SS type A sorting domain-containing protein n=1 Tax=Polaribacter sp. TaxID=1920175 RepID=UPI003BAE1CC2